MIFDFDIGVDFVPFVIGLSVVFVGFWVFRKLRQVKPELAHEWVERGAVLLDVRSEAEFASGHLPGAINVPLPVLTRQTDGVGEVTKPVVVYCASGMRSALAERVLKRAGFTQVADLGSMSRW